MCWVSDEFFNSGFYLWFEVIDESEEIEFRVIGVWFIGDGENVVVEVVFRCGGERSDVGVRVFGIEFSYLRDDKDGDGDMVIMFDKKFSNFY